uniref:Yippee domain-containing protein n=1 Tax=Marmota marmota marmota TaxID=9994 RepID=A0A8C5ZJ43_MARMA
MFFIIESLVHSPTEGYFSYAGSGGTCLFKSFQAYLLLCHRIYSCTHCSAHMGNHDGLFSKPFQGSQRGACLFNLVVNMGCGPAEKQVSQTGWHTVAGIYCENCKTNLG